MMDLNSSMEDEMKLNIDTLTQACRKLRQDAEIVRAFGSDQTAVTIEACVDEFEIAIESWLDERLTPTQAGLEGPLAAATVAKHVREGRLPQAGRRGAPLVRRRDLFGILEASEPGDVIRLIVRGDSDAFDPNDPFPCHD
jgi:hypothetical protein